MGDVSGGWRRIRSLFGKGGKSTHRLGLEFREKGIAWAVGALEGTRIHRFGFQPAPPERRQESLTKLVRRLDLNQADVYLSLSMEQYQAHLVERPTVPDDELVGAVRWKLKDLIDYDVGEAVIDVFDFPSEAARGRPALIHVVSARRALLTEAVQAILGAGLRLQKIDIAELTLRNLAHRLDPDGQGYALLYLRDTSGLLVLGRGAVLYLARRVNFRLSMMEDSQQQDTAIQSLALEVQRSLDYYESQLRQAPPRRLHVQASDEQYPLATMLGTYLATQVESVPCEEILGVLEPSPPGDCLFAAGALLQIAEEVI